MPRFDKNKLTFDNAIPPTTKVIGFLAINHHEDRGKEAFKLKKKLMKEMR